jgi:hypothetical protein
MKHLRLALLALAFVGAVSAAYATTGSSVSPIAGADGGTQWPPHRN